MAAAGSAKSTEPGARSRSRPVPLSLEDARCPVCSEILLEPVTMPCGHSVCLPCFQRTVKLASLCCPLCRRRVSSWARKRSREKSLVDAELWARVRRSYPERCRRRLEESEREQPHGEIFRSPEPVLKSGEKRQEIERQNMKFEAMSDSENEEPVGKRTRHVSAFVRKTRRSPAFSRGCLQSTAVQRSRSCTDSEEARRKTRGNTNQALLEKASITYSFNAGILLSSENSRSFSTPLLSIDKRWRGIHSLGFQSKPERSISPESNDSISEELNHFKPIVCSPCTPPKRLSDGRLLEPTIVKSTPRNLTRSLQKATSYEASPSILQKWKQIEVDRQNIKMTSKGTITSPTREDIDEHDGRLRVCSKTKPGCDLSKDSTKDRFLICNRRRLIFDPCFEDGKSAKADNRATMDARRVCEPSMRDVLSGNQIPDLIDEPTTVSCVCNRPTSRKGRKRSHKTKHLEEKLPTNVCSSDRLQELILQRISQERDDRELAVKLQRQFDRESRKLEPDLTNKYKLRSWAARDGVLGRYRRRTRSQHLNHSC